jgi:antirestriction protein ArdC
MTEKNQQEKNAAQRQVDLLTNAFEMAKENGGVWLNKDSKQAPKFYQKGMAISPFNAIILGLHSDQNNYKTSEYTLFTEARKRGESVLSGQKGVPFNWYNWNQYQSKKDPDNKISREEYKALTPEQQTEYKGIRSREVRVLFNIEQTSLPMVDKNAFDKEVKTNGRLAERENIQAADKQQPMNDLIQKLKDNLVDIRLDTTGVAHYDRKQDAVYMPNRENYEHFNDYAQALVSQIVAATGHIQRLNREGMNNLGGKAPSEDAQKQEMLVREVATAAKMQEMGLPGKFSEEAMKNLDYWKREFKENPCLIDVIEKDVNNALDMIHKAERGEKVEKREFGGQKNDSPKTIIPKHYYVADEIKTLPNKQSKEMVVVRDTQNKTADVILPAGASRAVDNEIPGMNKSRIEHALQKEGIENVMFFNTGGSLGYHPDDSYFDGKDISVAKLNKWELEDITKLDVTDAVKRSGAVDFDKVLMLKDDDGKWAMFMKPENEKSFSVYPTKADVNKFFITVKQGNDQATESMRQDMATKYYVMANDKPELKVDLFKSKASQEDLSKFDRVNIFKTKEQENQPSKILLLPTLNGERLKPREVSRDQWQRLWLADDMQDYKKHLAASLFADVLRKDQSNSVAVGTSKTEQEAQTDVKEAQHAEFYEQNEKHEEKQEQEHADYHQQEDKKNSPEQKEKQQQEEKVKEQTTKAETKAVAAVALSPVLKQFYDLKAKHPDALLLFRTGDFYETYSKDAETASKILGITLTKSSKTQDKEGKPLALAGFPYHALDSYLPKLIRAGQRVAICDQIEAPKQTASRSSLEQAAQGNGTEKDQKAKPENQQSFHR